MNIKKQKELIKQAAREAMASGINIDSKEFDRILNDLFKDLLSADLKKEYFKDDEDVKSDIKLQKIKKIFQDNNTEIIDKLNQLFKELKIPAPEVNVNVPDVIVPPIEIPEIKAPDVNIDMSKFKVPIPKMPTPEINVNVPPIKIPDLSVKTDLPEHDEIEVEYSEAGKVIKAIYYLNGNIVLEIKVGYDKKGNPVNIKREKNESNI